MGILKRPTPETEAAETWTGGTWEYKALNLNFKASVAFEDTFNKLGAQGWEFQAWVGRDNVHRAIFKRPIGNQGVASKVM